MVRGEGAPRNLQLLHSELGVDVLPVANIAVILFKNSVVYVEGEVAIGVDCSTILSCAPHKGTVPDFHARVAHQKDTATVDTATSVKGRIRDHNCRLLLYLQEGSTHVLVFIICEVDVDSIVVCADEIAPSQRQLSITHVDSVVDGRHCVPLRRDPGDRDV